MFFAIPSPPPNCHPTFTSTPHHRYTANLTSTTQYYPYIHIHHFNNVSSLIHLYSISQPKPYLHFQSITYHTICPSHHPLITITPLPSSSIHHHHHTAILSFTHWPLPHNYTHLYPLTISIPFSSLNSKPPPYHYLQLYFTITTPLTSPPTFTIPHSYPHLYFTSTLRHYLNLNLHPHTSITPYTHLNSSPPLRFYTHVYPMNTTTYTHSPPTTPKHYTHTLIYSILPD